MPGATSALSRRTALFDEHVALGADMRAYAWAGMAMPWSYRTSVAAEQRAVRERCGLTDASQLQVVSVCGPGAVACMERLVPRRIGDLPVGASRFSVVLSRFGRICDEALIMRLDEREFWISHGCGATRAQLGKIVDAADVRVTPRGDTHVLALQGPSSLQVLSRAANLDLADLPFLGHRRVSLRGRPVVVSRTGFTGELGFEIFCDAEDAVMLWRLLQATGGPVGLTPYGYRCVDLLRIEAGFLLYPVDLSMAGSLREAGLAWLVRDKVADYVGRDKVERASGSVTHRFAGVRLRGALEVARGAGLRRGEREIGVVTSSAFSPASGDTLCIARVEQEALQDDAQVDVASTPNGVGRLVALPHRARRGGARL
ncbi:MAG TPA: aminomethyltransferase family protein [Polyangiaceae bacterium]